MSPNFWHLEPLLRRVARARGIPPHVIVSGGHFPYYVAARRSFVRAAVTRGFSYSELGRFLHLHHTSVMSLAGRLR